VRKGLLEIIELSFAERRQASPAPAAPPAAKPLFTVRAAVYAAAALLTVVLALVFLPMLIKPAGGTPAKAGEVSEVAATASGKKSAQSRTLDLSAAEPMTFNPGDFQYEQVYSVIGGKVESIGGGKSLVTLKVGLDFKGIINTILSNNDFRLVAAELNGPLAPANFLSILIDSKSYGEGDVKFEISDSITRFSVLLKGKEDRKWDFSIE
jgi:hypothetical protein